MFNLFGKEPSDGRLSRWVRELERGIERYASYVSLEVLPLIEDIRISRVKGKTLFEMAENEPSLLYICDYYLNIADQLLSEPEGVVPRELGDRELFTLLSDFYLSPSTSNTSETNNTHAESNYLDFFLV